MNRSEDSLLRCITCSLCDGLVYFNCYPQLLLVHRRLVMMKALTVNILSNIYDMDLRSSNMQVIYRTFYKTMNTSNPDVQTETFVKENKG